MTAAFTQPTFTGVRARGEKEEKKQACRVVSSSVGCFARCVRNYSLQRASFRFPLLLLPSSILFLVDKLLQLVGKAPVFLSLSLHLLKCPISYSACSYSFHRRRQERRRRPGRKTPSFSFVPFNSSSQSVERSLNLLHDEWHKKKKRHTKIEASKNEQPQSRRARLFLCQQTPHVSVHVCRVLS